MPIRLGVGTPSGEFHHVVGHRRDEHAGILAEDQIDQDDRQDRQEPKLDEQPEKAPGLFEEFHHRMRARSKPIGWGASSSPPELAPRTELPELLSSTAIGAVSRYETLRFENSHR